MGLTTSAAVRSLAANQPDASQPRWPVILLWGGGPIAADWLKGACTFTGNPDDPCAGIGDQGKWELEQRQAKAWKTWLDCHSHRF